MTYEWYFRVYVRLIETRKYRGNTHYSKNKLRKENNEYYELHHILPKSLGGKDVPENRVILTFREHILAHRLLLKIHPNNKAMMKALTRMLTCEIDENGKKVKKILKSAREAEYVRKLYSESLTGDGNPNYGKVGALASHYGIKHSDETKQKISRANKGRLVGRLNPMYGIHLVGDSNPMWGKFGGSHPASKKVIDKNGKIYDCLLDAAKENNVDRHTLSKWIKNKPEKGFRFLD